MLPAHTGMESETEAAQQSPPQQSPLAKRSKVDDLEEEKNIGYFIEKLKKTDARYYLFQFHNLWGIKSPMDFRVVYRKQFDVYTNMENPFAGKNTFGHVEQISYDEIVEITDNFVNMIQISDFGELYGGRMKDNDVLVKKWVFSLPVCNVHAYYPQRFASQLELLLNRDVVEHPKVAKLIGFCCETFLALVWDLKLNRTLQDLVPQDSFTWDQRMMVAGQVAETLDFFHNKKIALCNFFSPCISVDEEYNIKLFELDYSVNLAKVKNPEEEFFLKDSTYYSPEAQDAQDKYPTGFVIGWFYASDVYHFGLLLLELTLAKLVYRPVLKWVESGKEAFENARTCSSPPLHPQKTGIFGLAMKCLHREPFLRPCMAEVVHEFRRISNHVHAAKSI